MNDDWVYPTNQSYQPYIVELMEFFHGCVDYPSNKTFTRQELLELEPMDIYRWLAHKAYGDPDYNRDNVDRPIYIRSNTLEFAKKSVSFFMPNRNPCWVNGVGGNPTKSRLVNHILREVKALESARGQKDLPPVRPITEAEFRRTIHLFHGQSDWRTKCKFTTMALLQYHLMARMDDIAHFETNHLKSHENFDFALQANVRQTKQASQQGQQQDQQPPTSHYHILLGSIDSMSCIIMNLGLYLESFLRNAPQSKYVFTGSALPKASKQLLQTYRSRLETVVFQCPNFRALSTEDPRRIETESYRKFPCQHAMEKGASQEHVEIRSEWKKRGQRNTLANATMDPSRVIIDAKVASLLCVGGPITYKLRPDIVISDEWLFENIVPNIHRRYPEDTSMCKMFALAILCAAMDREGTGMRMPQPMREQVILAYAGLGFDETHPVMKVPLQVYNMDQQLRIDLAVPISATTPMQGSIPIQAILLRIDQLERNTANYHRQHQESIQRMEQTLVTQLSTINSSICRVGGAVLDALGRQTGPMTGNPRQSQQYIQCQDLPAFLSKNPRTLMELWKEYKFGITGHKPAEQFTTLERNSRVGGVKQKYYRRRMVWECMERLVRRGDSPQVAANKILNVYGRDRSVSQIINLMIRDRPTGGHPNLR